MECERERERGVELFNLRVECRSDHFIEGLSLLLKKAVCIGVKFDFLLPSTEKFVPISGRELGKKEKERR